MTNYTPSEKGKGVLRQFDLLKTVRQPLDKEWQDAYRYTYPTLGVGFNRSDDDGITAAQTTKNDQVQLFDTTATNSVRLLSSSVLSSLTPSSSTWFELADPQLDEEELDQDGKEWLEEAAERIHAMIHSSNYDSESLEFVMHLMISGMAGLYVELKDGKYHFETWPLNHLYCQETLNLGYIDTVYRSFAYTCQEAVNEFGEERLPENIRECYKTNPYDPKTFKFVVGIRPRLKGRKQSSGKTSRNLPWESIWVASCGTVVKESGFNEMPVIVPRWLKIPDTDYARGPVFDALPEIKSLNKVKEQMHLNMDMHITGMFKVKDDGTVNPNTIKFGARRIIPVGDMDNFQPIAQGGDVQFAMNEIASMQASIRSILLADQLGPIDKGIQTATEVQTRNNQIRQILGPIFARLQSEFLMHLVTRCFGLAVRANLLPPIPDSIRQGAGSLEIGYRSPLARSQRMQELQAIDEMTTRVERIAQANPAVLDYINYDRIVQKFGDLLSVDPELINDESAVKKVRYLRDKAKQEQQAAAERVAMSEYKPAKQEAVAPTASPELALMG